MPAYKSLLCPVDFSDCSQRALDKATELALASHARLTLAHIWQPPLYGIPDVPISPDLIGGIVESDDQLLATWVASAKTAGVEDARSVTVTGVPWDEIVKLVANGEYDLIVMGTHGRTGIGRVLLGSVAERVIRHAPCAVLVVR
jgi:nucleotide-binding universal stress UspA family protein